MKPQFPVAGLVVVVVVLELAVVVVVLELAVVVVVVDDSVVDVVSMVPGGDPHPTRLALTTISSSLPSMDVPAPPKLSTPNPIQSSDCGSARPAGTPEPMPLGESQTTGLPPT